MKIWEKFKAFWKKKAHRHTWAKYQGEELSFYWEVPWQFIQEFKVCEKCLVVKVIHENQTGNLFPDELRKEQDGQPWSGSCDYATKPSTGEGKLYSVTK